MASLKQNEETKKWEFVFDYYDELGRRRQVRRKGLPSKREANDLMITLQNEVKNNQFVGINHEILNDYMVFWLDNVRKLECEATTHYNNILYHKNHISKSIGLYKLQNLTPMICQRFINDLHDRGYARNTIDRISSLVKIALDRAVDYKIIKDNPMRKVTLPKKRKKELRIWTTEQANAFLKFTKGRRYHCVYALALLTGMRQGEILGLRWKDIDFKEKTISVRQTLSHYGKDLKIGAKTVSGDRKISIPSQLVEILREQQAKYQQLKSELKEQFVDIDIVIFNLKNGGTIFPSNMVSTYIKDVEKSGLPHIRFHDLRHTHATMLMQKDINVKVVSERLGHSKVGITLDVYSHVLPSMQEEVASKLESMITL